MEPGSSPAEANICLSSSTSTPWSPGASDRKKGRTPGSVTASRPPSEKRTWPCVAVESLVAATALTRPSVEAVMLRICLRASVPLSATVFWSVRACTREKTTTSPADDLLDPLETAYAMPPAASTTTAATAADDLLVPRHS